MFSLYFEMVRCLGCLNQFHFQVLENLEQMQHLTALYLGKNKISKICHLEHLPQITVLSLQVCAAVAAEKSPRIVNE